MKNRAVIQNNSENVFEGFEQISYIYEQHFCNLQVNILKRYKTAPSSKCAEHFDRRAKIRKIILNKKTQKR